MEFAETVQPAVGPHRQPTGERLMTPACREAPRSFFVAGNADAERTLLVRLILLLVFGGAGTLARYGLDGWIQYRTGSGFPYGILTINVLGCFLLGVIGQFGLNHLSMPPDLRIGLTTGLMGGFTTFSTFGWDSVRMLESGEWSRALAYIGASVLGGLAAMMLGMRTGNLL
jgi:fluoride exporter